MKAIAKYIPVEEEIKVGDSIINDLHIVTQVTKILENGDLLTSERDLDPCGETYLISKKSKSKKVGLFAIVSNLKENGGEILKVTFDHKDFLVETAGIYDNLITVVNDNKFPMHCLKFAEEDSYLERRYTVVKDNGESIYRVLGKISEQAHWIKQGDEIEVREEVRPGPPSIYEVTCQCCGDYK